MNTCYYLDTHPTTVACTNRATRRVVTDHLGEFILCDRHADELVADANDGSPWAYTIEADRKL